MSASGDACAARYRRDGFVFPIDVMTEAEAANYRGQLEKFEAKHPKDSKMRGCLRRYPNLVLPFVDEISRHAAMTDAVAEILGPDLLVLDCPFFVKEPRTGAFVSWHQDLHYWGIDGDEEVTAWVALSPANTESGCMRFVAGSHTEIVAHRDTHHDQNLLSRGQEITVEVDERHATEVVLKPGQMSLHHGRVLHASHPNASNDRRIGLAIRYVSTRTKQVPGSDMAAMLVRGEDRHGHFRHCHRPSGQMSEADLAHWAEIADARNSVLMRTTQAAP